MLDVREQTTGVGWIWDLNLTPPLQIQSDATPANTQPHHTPALDEQVYSLSIDYMLSRYVYVYMFTLCGYVS